MLWRKKSASQTTCLPLQTTPTRYPVGSFIQTEKGYFFIKSNDKRLRIVSDRVLQSWAPPRVVCTTERAVVNYKITARMKFRNGTLIKNIADGKVYLIEESLRRHIVSPDAYSKLGILCGVKDEYIIEVSLQEALMHELGEDLS